MNDLVIRVAGIADAPRLLEIYAPYVTDTAITFEYDVPAPEEFAARISGVLSKYPYLVAVRDGNILGYAYASGFKERAAYEWSVETSIYVERSLRRTGIGRELYTALETCLAEQGVTNVNACIGVPSCDDDPYVDRSSVNFHARMGYRAVGEFSLCASKFGRWYNMVWMEKQILPHLPEPERIKRFDEVRDVVREKYGII